MTDISYEYSDALFMLAAEHGAVDKFSDELTEIHGIIAENPQYSLMLSSPAIPISERLDAIDKAFGNYYSELIVSFIKLLCLNGRIQQLLRCIEEFESLRRFASNTAAVTVYSAVELDSEQKERLCKKLEKYLAKKIIPTYKPDKNLIGGVKIEVDGKVFDGSIKNHLKKLRGVMADE